jgi:hypothetical protein
MISKINSRGVILRCLKRKKIGERIEKTCGLTASPITPIPL